MHEMEDFENLLIEYGQMPTDDALKALYSLNQIKGEEKKPKKAVLLNIAQMWSWA